MKVLHLSSEATWRGGEQQIIYLVEEMAKFDCQSIVACREGSAVEKYCIKNGLNHYSVPFKSAYHLKTVFLLLKLIRKEKFDLIHSHTSKSFTVAVILGLLGAKPVQLTTRRVYVPVKNNWFSRFKYNYKKVKRIMCVSNAVADITEIKDPSRKVVIHSGIDMEKFKAFINSNYLREKYNLSEETICVANTSAITEVKDYPTFVRAAEKVLKKVDNVHFFIIGEGTDRVDIEKMVKKKGLSDKITFTGFIEKIKEVVPSYDVFLFTSKSEGLGTSVLDAMISGAVVVTTKSGGVNDIVTHQESGLLYDVGDSESIANGLINILQDSDLRNRLSDNALVRAADFSKEKTAKLTYEIYQEVVK